MPKVSVHYITLLEGVSDSLYKSCYVFICKISLNGQIVKGAMKGRYQQELRRLNSVFLRGLQSLVH